MPDTNTPDPSLRLDGQVALVTGAATGIGRATAEKLAIAGARVAINHLPGQEELAAEIVAGIHKRGGEATGIPADVSKEDDVTAMFARCVEMFGTVHILVNNAGIQSDSPFAEMSLEQWRRVLDINLTGQFLCARAAVREFMRRGYQPEISRATGKIICMSSVHQAIPWAGHANYAASKGGVTLLMETLAQEFAPQRIRVNSIAPGAIRTPINQSVWSDDASMKELLRLVPYGRIGEGEDVANTALFLACDLSDYINGSTIYVDGGMMLYPGFRGNG